MINSKDIIYNVFMENSHLGIGIFQDDKLVFANKKLAKIVGLTPKKLIPAQKEELIKMIHPADHSKVLKQIDLKMRGINSGKIIKYEMRILDKNKKTIEVEIYSDSIVYEGKPAIFLTIKKIKRRMGNNTIKERDERDLNKLTNNKLEVLSLFFNRIRNQITQGKNLHSIEIYVSEIIDKIQSIKEKRLFKS